MLPQLPQKDKEKDAFSVLLRLFSVLLTVLSILILTYKDLRFNSKTLPMLRQKPCQLPATHLCGEKLLQNLQAVLRRVSPQDRA